MSFLFITRIVIFHFYDWIFTRHIKTTITFSFFSYRWTYPALCLFFFPFAGLVAAALRDVLAMAFLTLHEGWDDPLLNLKVRLYLLDWRGDSCGRRRQVSSRDGQDSRISTDPIPSGLQIRRLSQVTFCLVMLYVLGKYQGVVLPSLRGIHPGRVCWHSKSTKIFLPFKVVLCSFL